MLWGGKRKYETKLTSLVPPSLCINYSKANKFPHIAKQIAERMQVDNFVASDLWLCQFIHCHGLVYKKVPGESAVNTSDQVTGRI
jgi:hypothetical protein